MDHLRRKALGKARSDELECHTEALRRAAETAQAAYAEACRRDAVLLPVMAERGFETAGEAIVFLGGRYPAYVPPAHRNDGDGEFGPFTLVTP